MSWLNCAYLEISFCLQCRETLMQQLPKITVYIPSHNYGRYLSESIESVLRQSMADWELLLINDASHDNTQEIMQFYANHPKIRIFNTPGLGLPGVCNLAVKEAKGTYIIRLDADDIFDENILLVLSNYLDQNPDTALVFPDYYLFNENGDIYAHEIRKKIYAQNHLVDMPPNGACTLVRVESILKVNGYREDLGMQDGFDLWTKISSNYKCANINLPLFFYRRHGNNLTENKKRIFSARQQIKKDSALQKLKDLSPVIAVIPIREHYDFRHNLWDEKINGKSLLYRDIEFCLGSKHIDYVVVTCDTQAPTETLNQFNDSRLKFFHRDHQSTFRTASIVPTLEKIAKEFDPKFKGLTILRYIQSPFVSTNTLEEAMYHLAFSEADSACGVQIIESDLFKRNEYGLTPLNERKEFYSDFDIIYKDSRTCLATKNCNLLKGTLTGPSVAYFEVSTAECFFMSSDRDLKIANILEEKSYETAV